MRDAWSEERELRVYVRWDKWVLFVCVKYMVVKANQWSIIWELMSDYFGQILSQHDIFIQNIKTGMRDLKNANSEDFGVYQFKWKLIKE